MTDAPYIIRRIQLDELRSGEPVTTIPGQRYYFSCWWKDVPLGHLFVEEQEHPDKLQQRIWEAIGSAVHFYQNQTGIFSTVCESLFLQEKYGELGVYMDQLFARHTDLVLPSQTDISVVICTRNRSHDLQRCLHSLMQQSCAPSEIIVVDNAPIDDSTMRVVQQFEQVIYHKEPRGGLSIARNAGLRIATSPVIAFTDDDVQLHPLWLYHVRESFSTPQVGAMTGLVIASSLATNSQQLFEKEWSFNGGYRDKLYDGAYFTKSLAAGPRVWEIGAGANMAFRRSALEGAGWFDERLGAGAAGCSEDSELWYRLLAKGIAIHYNPRAVVFHEHRRELNELQRQLFCYMKGHAAAALIQQSLIKEAGYQQYLFKKVVKSYLPLLIKRFFHPLERKLLLNQVHGIFSGILFYFRNKNKPAQTAPRQHQRQDRQPAA